MNPQTRVSVLRELLADANNRAAEIEAKLADLHAERRGLELALARLTARAADDDVNVPRSRQIDSEPVALPRQAPESIPHGDEWRMLGTTEAVKRVLEQATKPLGPAEIVDKLNSVGLPQKNSEAVRGSLAYLKRKGKATFIGRSQWVLIGGEVHKQHQRETGTTDFETTPVLAGAVSNPIHPVPISEGGDASGTGFDRAHDDGSSWQASHRVHGQGSAPIGAPN